MTADELRAIQAPLKERYKADPAAAQSTLTARGTLDVERLVCRIDTGRDTVTESGLHPMTGGGGSWTCSGDMLLESLVACAGVTLCAVATAIGIPFVGGEVKAEGDLDFRGTLGVSREVPVGFSEVRLKFCLETSADDAQLEKLAGLTERFCVVAQSLKPSVDVTVTRRSS